MHHSLAIVITHPIQYYVPVFQLLAQQCQLKVFYTWGEAGVQTKHDPGFGKTIEWDMPLLAGYDYELLNNIAADPGSHHGKGIVNPDLIEKIDDFAPDAILVYGYIYHSHFQVMRYFKGKIPILFRGDSTLLDPLPWYKAIAKKLYLSWVYRHIDQAFYVGKANKMYYKAFGLKEKQLFFAPHAIDNNRFSENRNEEAKQLRASIGLKNNEQLIVFAGKLEPKKDPEILLKAFIELNKTNVHLLFVGNGVLEESLKLYAKNFQEEKSIAVADKLQQDQDNNLLLKKESQKINIHFMDFQNQTQMPVIYQACDLFCLPSKGPGETWGLAVNEAMACGKAILVSDKVGCAIDLVKNEENGAIFESGNIQDLLLKLTQLTENKKNLKLMGEKSKEIIKNWTINLQAEVILNALYS